MLRQPLDGAVCDTCWSSLRVPPFLDERDEESQPIAWRAAVGAYEGRMQDIIHALKYDRRQSIAPRLGALMRAAGAAMLDDADGVVPVPLHPWREYRRGFNQAYELAIHLGPPVLRLLKRVRHTTSQIDLPRDRRLENVRDAFAIDRPEGVSPPNKIVLVDDVATTGATLDSCARVLKAAGIREVRALTAARVVSARR